MVERVKIEPKIITIHEGRASFLRTEASYRTDKFGREIKVDPKTGKPTKARWSMTWLLDPSNAQAAATIKEIKEEAARQLDLYFNGRENWPKDNKQTGTKGIVPCFGNANDLTKIYDGYKDMFFIKVSDTTQPTWGDRRGRALHFDKTDGAWHVIDATTKQVTDEIVPADQAPYSGAFCRGRISLYVYNNEQAGVNANMRSVQFVRTGDAFGGGRARNAAEELEQMAGDEPVTAGASPDGDDPFA